VKISWRTFLEPGKEKKNNPVGGGMGDLHMKHRIFNGHKNSWDWGESVQQGTPLMVTARTKKGGGERKG